MYIVVYFVTCIVSGITGEKQYSLINKYSKEAIMIEPASSELIDSSPEMLAEIKPLDRRHHSAFLMKMKGMKVSRIAEVFGVSERTVFRWFTAYEQEFREGFEAVPAANLIAKQLAVLEEIERLNLAEANECESNRDRIGFYRVALIARGKIIDLMTQTGVIPKEPEKVYSVMVEKKPKSLDTKPEAEVSREELERRIMQLLRFGRELPPLG